MNWRKLRSSVHGAICTHRYTCRLGLIRQEESGVQEEALSHRAHAPPDAQVHGPRPRRPGGSRRPRILSHLDELHAVRQHQDRLRQPDHRAGIRLRRARLLRSQTCPRRVPERPLHRRHQLLGGDRQSGRSVDTRCRRAGGQRSHPDAEGRSHAHHIYAGNGEPGFRRVRGGRRAVHLDCRALGGLVPGPRRQARAALAFQVDLPLLLWRRAVLSRVHALVAAGHDQQEGGSDVAE